MNVNHQRSWLFVPGMDERKIEKAVSLDADVLILDLEDAVALSSKPRAREITHEAIRSWGARKTLFVRVNDWTTGLTTEDLRAVCIPGLSGIVLPKVEDVETVRAVSNLIATLENQNGVVADSVEMLGIIESAAGVLNVGPSAKADKRLQALMPGAGDLTHDLGIPTSNIGAHILNAKIQVALASIAGGLAGAIDTAFFDVADNEGYRADCEQAKSLGFQGKAAIHPTQVAIANEVFSPSEREIAEALSITEAFRDAERAGVGAITVNNKLVDYAMVKTADKLLAKARALGLVAQ